MQSSVKRPRQAPAIVSGSQAPLNNGKQTGPDLNYNASNWSATKLGSIRGIDFAEFKTMAAAMI